MKKEIEEEFIIRGVEIACFKGLIYEDHNFEKIRQTN